MKILRADQIREADQATINNEPISSLDLMERATGTFFHWMNENIEADWSRINVFAGVGNNGGDGLVLARLYAKQGVEVRVFIIHFTDNSSPDFNENLNRLRKTKAAIIDLKECPEDFGIGMDELIVDAVFGSGLNRPVTGWLKDLFQMISNVPAYKVSVDIPSGMYCDFNDENDLEAIVHTDLTLGFQCPKLAYFLTSTTEACGDWAVLDIGLDKNFLANVSADYEAISRSLISGFLQSRSKVSHKNQYGHALIAAGSKGKMGAAVLATRACLKCGIGLITNYAPEWGAQILQSSVPEAMVITSNGEILMDMPENIEEYSVLGIGPGIGTNLSTAKMVEGMISTFPGPLVLDADAINILSDNKDWLKRIPAGSILTPHPGEFRRLVGEWLGDREKLEKQVQFSDKYGVYTVLKGAHTSISTPERKVYFNTNGNPGMATAGSGDVLLGMITGLLGRGYSPLEATLLGVFMHGFAGDLAAIQKGEESMVAGDVVNQISHAFNAVDEGFS